VNILPILKQQVYPVVFRSWRFGNLRWKSWKHLFFFMFIHYTFSATYISFLILYCFN